MKHAIRLISPLAGLLTLNACGANTPPPHLYCPAVAVLEQANTLNEFLPGRQDIAAEITQARVTGVAGSCTLEPKKNLLAVKFQAGFTASDGPANTSSHLVLPYFVSISQGDTIASKANYAITVHFEGNAASASAATKPILVEFPNTPDNDQTEVLVGFQLTPDQLAYAAAHPLP